MYSANLFNQQRSIGLTLILFPFQFKSNVCNASPVSLLRVYETSHISYILWTQFRQTELFFHCLYPLLPFCSSCNHSILWCYFNFQVKFVLPFGDIFQEIVCRSISSCSLWILSFSPIRPLTRPFLPGLRLAMRLTGF